MKINVILAVIFMLGLVISLSEAVNPVQQGMTQTRKRPNSRNNRRPSSREFDLEDDNLEGAYLRQRQLDEI